MRTRIPICTGEDAFFDQLPGEVEFLNDSPPKVRERERPLLELQRQDFAEGYASIDKLAGFVWDQVPRRLRGEFAESLSEVAANVIEYAQANAAFLVGPEAGDVSMEPLR